MTEPSSSPVHVPANHKSEHCQKGTGHVDVEPTEKKAPWIQDVPVLTIDDYLENDDLVSVDTCGDASFTGVWSAAKALLEFIESETASLSMPLVGGGNILELGAGTGWLGMTLARNLGGGGGRAGNHLPLRVVLTDSGTTGAAEWTRLNVESARYQKGIPHLDRVSVVPMDWNQDTQVIQVAESCPWDWIMGSDLIYSEDGIHALSRAMKLLLVHSQQSQQDNALAAPRIIYAHTLGRMPELDQIWEQALTSNGLEWTVLAQLPVMLYGVPWEGRSTVIMDIYLKK